MMTIIKNKDVTAEKLKFVARKLTYTTRLMKHKTDDTQAIAYIALCNKMLTEILNENTNEADTQ